MQDYIVHKAYWLSYRYGNQGYLMFDEPFDLDYLGAVKDDIRRSVWVLSENQLLENRNGQQAVARPTIKLVEAYLKKSTEASDETFERMAIQEARQSIPEDEQPRPKVGVVVVKDGVVLAKAHRGEIPECHAEFIALEKKLADVVLAGATVYTTLEPCTTRNHPKLPCATRLTERKVARVVIGMLDPNKDISGRGQRRLRKANITTDFFKADLMQEIEELNREFIRAHENPPQSTVDRGYKSSQLEDHERRTELSVFVPSSKVMRVANTGTRVITKIIVYETDYEFNRESFEVGRLVIQSYSKPNAPIAMFEKVKPEQTETLDLRTIGFFNFANEIPKAHDAITTLTKVYCLRFEFQSGGRGYVLYRTISSVVDMPSFLDDGAGVAGGTQFDYLYEIPECVRQHQKRLFADANLVDISPTRQPQR